MSVHSDLNVCSGMLSRRRREGGPAPHFLVLRPFRARASQSVRSNDDPHSSKYDYSAKQSLWTFTTERVALLSGATKAPEAAVALWALLHGTVALEATQVLGEDKPASGLRFIFEAWLSAVSSASSADQAENNTTQKVRLRNKKTASSKLR